MKKYLLSIITTVALILVSLNMPVHYLDVSNWFRSNNLGANLSLTDISGTEQLSSFPTVFNANNTLVEESINSIIGTTTISTLTSASSLATIGTITTGIWNGTPVGVIYGGTGTTSPTVYRVMLGDADRGFTMASTSGTSGQFFTSGGAGAYPSWTTGGVNQTQDYGWTGSHLFKTGKVTIDTDLKLKGDSTDPFSINGIKYNFPTTTGGVASSSVLAISATAFEGTGTLSWIDLKRSKRVQTATTSPSTDVTVSTTGEQEIFTRLIPANTMSTTTVLLAKLFVTDFDITNGTTPIINFYFGNDGSPAASCNFGDPGTNLTNLNGMIDFQVIAADSLSAQDITVNYWGRSNANTGNPGTDTAYCNVFGAETQDTTIDSFMYATIDFSSTGTITIGSSYVKVID